MLAPRDEAVDHPQPFFLASDSPHQAASIRKSSDHEEVTREIGEAIDFRLEGLKLSGTPIPEPTCIAEFVKARLTIPFWLS